MSGIRARYGLPQPPGEASVTIEVPVGRSLDFDLSPREARALFEQGRRATAAQLAALVE